VASKKRERVDTDCVLIKKSMTGNADTGHGFLQPWRGQTRAWVENKKKCDRTGSGADGRTTKKRRADKTQGVSSNKKNPRSADTECGGAMSGDASARLTARNT
jgi:hypothetical protein